MARIRRHRRDTVQSPLETYLREINEVALLTAETPEQYMTVAAQLANPGAPNAWARPLVMISQIWPYTFIVWTTWDAAQHLPVMWRWLGAAVILAALMILMGMAIFSLRKVSRRPHPFVEV